jgi:hypothetical protein
MSDQGEPDTESSSVYHANPLDETPDFDEVPAVADDDEPVSPSTEAFQRSTRGGASSMMEAHKKLQNSHADVHLGDMEDDGYVEEEAEVDMNCCTMLVGFLQAAAAMTCAERTETLKTVSPCFFQPGFCGSFIYIRGHTDGSHAFASDHRSWRCLRRVRQSFSHLATWQLAWLLGSMCCCT